MMPHAVLNSSVRISAADATLTSIDAVSSPTTTASGVEKIRFTVTRDVQSPTSAAVGSVMMSAAFLALLALVHGA